MTITVKNEADLVVPPSVRRKAGIKAGDQLEIKASRGVITIVTKPGSTADEYTPEQRRLIHFLLDYLSEQLFSRPGA